MFTVSLKTVSLSLDEVVVLKRLKDEPSGRPGWPTICHALGTAN
jgi:hypothetical protein